MEAFHEFLLKCPYIDENVIKIGLAVILGVATGIEREYRGRAAGIRTILLVCLGSTIAMLASVHISEVLEKGVNSSIQIDPTRIAQGIVTGIGFLGAGAIIRENKLTIGLTTASLIWFNAGLGILIGLGLYAVAIKAAMIAVFLLILLNLLEKRMNISIYRDISLVASYNKDIYSQACEIITQNQMTITQRHITRDLKKGIMEMTFNVKASKKKMKLDALDALTTLPGVKKVRWG